LQLSRLREDLMRRADAGEFLCRDLRLSPTVAGSMLQYLHTSVRVLGVMPSATTVVAERFFDESGGMQLIIHAPFGSRVNRAWGLALRKKFCRNFDFELQAAANDDALLLSLSEQHSFPLSDIFDYLRAETVEEVLTQAVLQTPLFGTRFRWNASRALALSRYSKGRRVPPQIQRGRSEDLLAAVFPAQVGCQDNHGGGDIELPDHPLVKETMDNCLREALDVDGLKAVLGGIRRGDVRTVAVDLPEPSPLAHHILNSQPYTFLDEAPLEERRARAVKVRRTLAPEDASAFGALDASAIAQVIADAAPPVRDAEELHDALLQLVLAPESVLIGWRQDAESLRRDLRALEQVGRVAHLSIDGGLHPEREAEGQELRGPHGGFWVAAERVGHVRSIFPEAVLTPPLVPLRGDEAVDRDAALVLAARGHLEVCGPVTADELAARLTLKASDVTQALFALEAQGQVLRGAFRHAPSPANKDPEARLGEWCDRRLLQRVHRLTVGRLRREIEPLSGQDFMRFLFRWHHLGADDKLRGGSGLLKAVSLLEGYEAPAAAWELSLLPARVQGYEPGLLERACWSGELAFGRLTLKDARVPGPRRGTKVAVLGPQHWSGDLQNPLAAPLRGALPGRNASLTFCQRTSLDWMLAAARPGAADPFGAGCDPRTLTAEAKAVMGVLRRRGASFFAELVAGSGLAPEAVEDGLWELLGCGWVTSDVVENLRILQSPKRRKKQKAQRRGGPGRWSLLAPLSVCDLEEANESVARLLLQRYGIVWRDLAVREPLCPAWRELLTVYRRLEARGEIRGGRFVSGMAGEQYALPEAVDLSRAVRRTAPLNQVIEISAVDPLNLTSVVTPGPRIPAVMGH
ncbi:MAG TPA: DEAD/DEAH box helicase, partial [Myxococcaceae bacterium]|nr:DEAD/DEAH box helicase [Myxococcaceae bacterium]